MVWQARRKKNRVCMHGSDDIWNDSSVIEIQESGNDMIVARNPGRW